MDPSSFFPIISGMLGGAASAGLFKGPIQTVEDWWYINFGHTSSEKAEMLRAKQKSNIDAYKNSLLEEASKIDPVNLKEPELKILGPALEASKYYIEDEELRNMFAKLIASSMDETKESIIHSSYVEIIKQLTPLDAENLKIIFNSGVSPILDISDKKGNSKFKNVFIANQNCQNYLVSSASLDNLARLGLVENSFMEWLEDDDYNTFKQLLPKQDDEFLNIRENDEFSETRGLTRATSFGKNFCATCL